jgi:hypothetical protein
MKDKDIERDHERAVAAEVKRLESITGREQLDERDTVSVTFAQIAGGPMPYHRDTHFTIDLSALLETIAEANVQRIAAMNQEAE